MKKATGILAFAALAALAVSGVLAMSASEENRATAADGAPAIARVLKAGDGSCAIGAKRQHCYSLELEVHPDASATFVTKLDVNIEDRYAFRMQPGAWIAIVRDRKNPAKVMINVDALAGPAPVPAATSSAMP